MTQLPPPDTATEFLAAPSTLLSVERYLERDAMEGGFVLVGPQAQGKATLAYMLAATLLSGGRRLGESDDKVRSLITAGAHPDLHVLERTENEKTGKLRDEIDVAAARKVIEGLHKTSISGRMVVIVDLADELRREAANSLLKILEEPPKGAVLLLLSQSTSRLLPTLTSRCRRLVLSRVAEEPLAAWLRTKTELSQEEATQIAAASGGAPGHALRLALGEGQEALAIADRWLRAVLGKDDLVAVSREFSGKAAEDKRAEATDLILGRLRKGAMANDLTSDVMASRIAAYEAAQQTFAAQGTADPAQTAYIAGLAVRDALHKGAA
ncbi:MAG: hypothetical protein AAFX52_04830 [Pseudomonadota bacterium]